MFSFTIKQRLYGLGVIVILSFAVFGLLYLYASGLRAEAAAEAGRSTDIQISEASAKIAILRARQNEKDFLLTHNRQYADKHAQSMTHFYQRLEMMQAHVHSKKGLKAIAELKDHSQEYEKGFQRMLSIQSRLAVNDNSDSLRKQVNGEVKVAIDSFLKAIQATEPEFQRIDQLIEQLKRENDAFQAQVNNSVRAVMLTGMVLGGIVILGSVIRLASSISRGLDKAIRVSKDVADGNLGLEIKLRTNDEIGELLTSMKLMDANLRRVVTEVQDSVANISSASGQIAQGNLKLSQRTEEQASSLEETASSMEEMTSTVKQSADSAIAAKQLADANREKAIASADVVSRTVGAMDDIDESSNKIADIIGTIDGIAFQTNLLALNAAVEAARAGDQGRGFAVVASEVRSLAQRSADAAKEIKGLIEDSVSKVKIGSELVNESGQTLKEITENTRKVADLIDGIAVASNEQANGIGQVNNAITQMDGMTQENASLVGEAAAASKSMQNQARNLDEVIAFFNIKGQIRKQQKKQTDEVVAPQSAVKTEVHRGLTQSNAEEQWQDF